MLVSQTAEYALRAMVFLAGLPAGAAATSRQVSKATAIPPTYAAKVLRRMVAHGLLIGQKGHGGGFQLARPAARIRFQDILEAVDENVVTDRCAFGLGRCNTRRPCPLHESASSLRESVLAWARSTTLADVQRRTPARRQATAQILRPA